MYENDSVNDLYDRLHSYISGARVSLQEKHSDAIAISIMVLVTAASLWAFIWSLIDDLSRAVDARNPKTLEQAFKQEKHAEDRTHDGRGQCQLLPLEQF